MGAYQELELFCERCNKKVKDINLVFIYDVKEGRRRLMGICNDCFNEHTWEEVYNGETSKR